MEGGGGREEVGDGMQCIDHPHRNNPAGTGICAFCLQEKLGKLVSSSFPSPSPSSLSIQPDDHTRSHLPFLLPDNNNNNKPSSSKSRRNHGFWSFLYPSSKPLEAKGFGPTGKPKCVIPEEDKCLVSRSRSVGCGSRSFSGDFFDRISSGLGDCTLRRVESQRQGKPCIKERVRCAGIFGAFAITSSSSSWDDARGRSRGWAFATPIRPFATKASSKRARNNATPNLSPIPSLLTVRG